MGEQFAISLHNITKSFPGVKALDQVSFDVRYGTVHSIVGENGAGKSTLMKIINGMHRADHGEIYVNGQKQEITSPSVARSLGVSMIFQELVYVPNLTVAENLCLGRPPKNKAGLVDWKTMRRQAQEILDKEQIHAKPTTMMYQVPISDIQMLEIVKATYHNAKIIIMDEPTSSLTQHESMRLFDKIKRLRAEGCAIIYISHKMEEVFQLSDYVTIMRDGKSIKTAPISEFTERDVISMMVGREVDDIYPQREESLGQDVLRVENLCSGKVFQDVSFHVRAGEIVGFAGLVGAGRTEIVRAVCGMDRFDSGTVEVDGKKIKPNSIQAAIQSGLVMASEDRRKYGIIGTRSIKENISLPNLHKLSSGGFIHLRQEREKVSVYFDRLRIKANSMHTATYTLSGGNQQKVVLAKWLMAKPKVLVLDEPTRGIDVGAKYEIYEIMNEMVQQGMGVVMISSELPELLGMCKRVYVVAEGRIVGELQGKDLTQETVMTYATGGK